MERKLLTARVLYAPEARKTVKKNLVIKVLLHVALVNQLTQERLLMQERKHLAVLVSLPLHATKAPKQTTKKRRKKIDLAALPCGIAINCKSPRIIFTKVMCTLARDLNSRGRPLDGLFFYG